MNIGKRIYYDKTTGDVVQETGERFGIVIEKTVEQDFLTYRALAERVPDTVGMIQLEYGAYAEDFQRGRLMRIDTETEGLLFWYPEPGATPEPEPAKLSVEAKIIRLEAELTALKAAAESDKTALQLALAETNEQQLIDQTATQVGLAELAQAQADDTDTLQLAVAEVATLLTGGDN
jgi:hypothetical protein